MKVLTIIYFFIICLIGDCYSQVWQWSVTLDSVISNETNAPSRAFLWIPENCKQVRGVIIGQHNMLEEGIFEHPAFRKTMTELGFAEIWISPNLTVVYDYNSKDSIYYYDMLQKLASVSGYTELQYVPIIPIGHSALASYPWNFAAGNPDKTLAILSIHGDAPLTNLTGSGRPNPDWGHRNINGIPSLMVEGEYEWMLGRVSPALTYRQQHLAAPVSFLGDAGHGHFDYSDDLVNYLCMFIQKAAQYRLPVSMSLDKPVILKPVDPTKGWLADRFRPDSLPVAKAAPYKYYQGDVNQAFWYFDKEIANVTEKYYAKSRGKKNQYVSFVQNDSLLPFQPKLHARITPAFQPLQDGVSFHLAAAYTDSAHTRVISNHARSKINISRICGPVVKINDSTFSVRFYRMGFNSPRRSGEIWLMAANGGDDNYKSAVQQASIRIPISNTEGNQQQIFFKKISNQRIPLNPLSLKATASSGLPVYYYIMEGPAEVRKNKIVFTSIPPRSKYPLKVTVVAWQYGRSGYPKVKTAVPVFQTFHIIK